jgi:hypothetical protein
MGLESHSPKYHRRSRGIPWSRTLAVISVLLAVVAVGSAYYQTGAGHKKGCVQYNAQTETLVSQTLLQV